MDSTDPGPADAEPQAELPAVSTPARPARFWALDAVRGLSIVMMIMVNWPGNDSLPAPFHHTEWSGLSLADCVFPAFLACMGAAMPLATRTGWRRAFGRAIMLYLIGAALVSFRDESQFDMGVGVLQLTAVAYLLTWLILQLPPMAERAVVALILVAVTLAYLYASPDGVVAGSFEQGTTIGEWLDYHLGFDAHPENPHAVLPAVLTVYAGVLAGRVIKGTAGARRLIHLALLGGAVLAAGGVLSLIVPVNKYLWTPSFALVTGGLTILAIAAAALLVPPGSKGGPLLRPFVLVGGHAIVVYAFSEAIVSRSLRQWIWPDLDPIVTERWGESWAALMFPLAAVLTAILLAWVMERLNIHVRL